ncbi:hypothetical protein HPP92_012828 [Vanilla planifolia]|uniref:Uncharacterized protein n=1 Tax=Vanilla planifolia TaxID=51239 RepID=A0A835QXK2_VANPL|nr:hypothetical protein HPP92_012828 [Vanilla planifolia]
MLVQFSTGKQTFGNTGNNMEFLAATFRSAKYKEQKLEQNVCMCEESQTGAKVSFVEAILRVSRVHDSRLHGTKIMPMLVCTGPLEIKCAHGVFEYIWQLQAFGYIVNPGGK